MHIKTILRSGFSAHSTSSRRRFLSKVRLPLMAGLAAGLSLLVSSPVHATNSTWTGAGTDSNWTTTANWSAGVPNAAADNAFFGAAAGGTVNLNAPVTVATLLFGGQGGSYTISGTSALSFTAATTVLGILNTTQFSGTNQTETIAVPLTLSGGSGSALSLYNYTPASGPLAAGNLLSVTGNITNTIASGTSTLNLQGLGNGQITGNISVTGGGAMNLVVNGEGTWTLTGTNTYSVAGNTVVTGGTLKLDYSTSSGNKINSLGNLVLGNSGGASPGAGGILTMIGSNTNATPITQYVKGLVVNGGASTINLQSGTGTGSSVTLSVGTIGRNNGGTVNLNLTAGTGGGSTTLAVNALNTNGILGGYATVGLTDWASSSSTSVTGVTFTTGTNVVTTSTAVTAGQALVFTTTGTSGLAANTIYYALGSGTSFTVSTTPTGTAAAITVTTTGGVLTSSGILSAYTGYTTDTWNGTSNTNFNQSNQAVAANATVNSLRFNNAGSNNLILTSSGTNVNTISSGGILVTPNVTSDVTISGGAITSGGNDLIIHQNSASNLNISSQITGNKVLTKDGTGNLILSGNNNYIGASFLDQGKTTIGSSTALGGANGTVNAVNIGGAGMILDLNGYNISIAGLASDQNYGIGGSVAAAQGYAANVTNSAAGTISVLTIGAGSNGSAFYGGLTEANGAIISIATGGSGLFQIGENSGSLNGSNSESSGHDQWSNLITGSISIGQGASFAQGGYGSLLTMSDFALNGTLTGNTITKNQGMGAGATYLTGSSFGAFFGYGGSGGQTLTINTMGSSADVYHGQVGLAVNNANGTLLAGAVTDVVSLVNAGSGTLTFDQRLSLGSAIVAVNGTGKMIVPGFSNIQGGTTLFVTGLGTFESVDSTVTTAAAPNQALLAGSAGASINIYGGTLEVTTGTGSGTGMAYEVQNGLAKLNFGGGGTLLLDKGGNSGMTLTLGSTSSSSTTGILARASNTVGTLIISAKSGLANLGTSTGETLNAVGTVGNMPVNSVGGIVVPYILGQDSSNANLSGGFLTYTGTGGGTPAGQANTTDAGFKAYVATGAALNSINSSTGTTAEVITTTGTSSTLTAARSAYALEVDGATVNLAGFNLTMAGQSTAVPSAIILNGGTISNSGTAGTLSNNGIEMIVYSSMQNGTISAQVTGNGGLTVTGPGILNLTAVNTYSGATTINSGVLDVGSSYAGLGSGVLNLRGGVLQGSGLFSRNIGTSAGQVNFGSAAGFAGGGFSARGGSMTVTLNGGSQLIWGTGSTLITTNAISAPSYQPTITTNFIPEGGVLMFGSATSDNIVHLTNSIDLGITPYNNSAAQATGNFAGQYSRIVNVTRNAAEAATGVDIFLSKSNAQLDGVISSSDPYHGFTKDGAGLLFLTNGNTYVGATTIANGTLGIYSDSSLGAAPTAAYALNVSPGNYTGAAITVGALVINGGATLGTAGVVHTATNGFTASNTLTLNANRTVLLASGTGASYSNFEVVNSTILAFGGKIADYINEVGSLGKLGTGTMIYTGTASYSGNTDINQGTFQLGYGGSLASTTGLILGGTTVTSSGANEAAIIANANTIQTSGTFILGDANGAVNQTVSSLTTSGSGTANAVVGGASTVSTLTVNNANTDNYTGNLGGVSTPASNLALTKSGAGALTLSGTNAYSGPTTITGGTLNVLTGLSSGNALTFAGAGGVFTYGNTAGTQTMGALTATSGASRVQNTVGTSLSFSSLVNSTYATGNASLNFVSNAGTNNISITGLTPSQLIASNLFYNGSNFAAYDSGGYVRGLSYGSDANTTSTASSFSNTGGTQNILATGNITGQGSAQINTLNLQGSSSITQTSTSVLAVNSILKEGTTGTSTISGGHLTATGTGNTLYVRTDVSGDSLTIGDAIDATTGSLSKSGAGTLTLSGTNAYTGTTYVNAGTLDVTGNNTGAGKNYNVLGGTLQIGTGGSISNLSSVTLGNSLGNTNGTLMLGDATGAVNQTIASLVAAGNGLGNSVVGGFTSASTLTVANGALDTYSGTLGGIGTNNNNLALSKSNLGTLVLTGTNSYTGATTVTGGNLDIKGNNAGSTAYNVSGGTLQIGYGGSIASNSVITLGKAGLGGILTLGDSTGFVNVTVSGLTDINSGGVGVNGSYNAVISGNASASSLTINTSGYDSYSGFIGMGSVATSNIGNDIILVKAGSGVLVLGGSNTYTGGTQINGGTLVITNAGALGATNNIGTITFGGGTLQYGTGVTTDYSSKIALSTGAISIDTNGNNVTWATQIGTNTGGFTKIGAGTLTLTNVNNASTFVGAITISGGGLIFGGSTLSSVTTGTANNPVVFNGAGGTFGFNTVSGVNQVMAGVTFLSGDDTLQDTYSGTTAGTATSVAYSGLTNAYTAGNATINFVSNTNTNKIVVTSGLTGNAIIAPNAFYNGSAFAAYDGTGTGYVRALTYGTDTNSSTAATTFSNTGGIQNIKLTAAVTGQGAADINTLDLSTFSLTQSASTTLAVNGILKEGGGSATISGGTLTASGTSGNTLYVRSNLVTDLLTISDNIAATTGNVVFTGSGTTTLNSATANAYTGGLYLNGGTVNLGSAGALATGAGNNIVFNGGTLQFSASNTTDYSAKIVNSGGQISIDTNGQTVTFANALASSNVEGLTKLGTGTLVLNGSNAYGGSTGQGTFVQNGTLQIATGTLPNYTTLSLGTASTTNYGTLTLGTSGSSGVNVTVSNILAFGTAPANDVIRGVGATNSILTVNVAQVSTGTTIYDDYTGTLDGTLTLTKTGGGTLVLRSVGTYTGGTYLNGGTIDNISNNASLGSTGSITFTGGTLQYGSNITTTDYSSRFKNSTGAITIMVDNGGQTYAGVIDSSNVGGFILKQGTNSSTIGVTLNALNQFSGDVTVLGGALTVNTLKAVGQDQSLGHSTNLILGNSVVANGTAQLIYTGTGTAANTLSQNVTVASGDTGTITNNNTGTNVLNIAGTVTKTNATLILTGTNTTSVINVSGKVTSDRAADTNFNSDLIVSKAVTTLTNANNDYYGYTIIGAGGKIIDGASTGALPTDTILVLGNGTSDAGSNIFDLAGATQTIGGLMTTGTIGADAVYNNSGTNGALTVNMTSGQVNVFAGVLGGSGKDNFSLTESGAGTLVLMGANTFTGGLNVQGGILQLGQGGSFSSTTALMLGNGSSSGRLMLGDENAAVNQTVSSLNSSGSGTANAIVGGYSSVSTLTVNNSSANTYAGAIGGTGTNNNNIALVKTGSGTLTLSGTSTYTGSTTVSGGTLAVNGALGNTAVTVTGAGLIGTGTIGGSVTLSGTSAFVNPGTVGTVGTLNVGSTNLGAGTLGIDIVGNTIDLLNVTGTLNISGATLALNFSGTQTLSSYTLVSTTGTITGSSFANVTGTIPTGYTLSYNTNSITLTSNPSIIGTITAVPTNATIITGGSTGFTVAVQNSATAPALALSAGATAGTNVTGSIAAGSITAAAGTTSSAVSGLTFNATGSAAAAGAQTGTFTVTDTGASNSPKSGSVSVNVLNHSNGALAVTSGNNQTVITGATGVTAGLTLTNAGTSNASMLVNSLGSGVSGTTATVATNGSNTNTAALNTGTVGAGQSQSFGITVQDQALPGQGSAYTASATATINVLGHSAPTLSSSPTGTSGYAYTINIGNIHQGATVADETTTLSNGSGYLAGLQIIDLDGLTDSGTGLIAAGTGRVLSATINTSTAGTYSVTYTIQTEDDQTYAGLGATTNTPITLTITGNIYTGQGVWTKSGNGTYNYSDASNWTTGGGAPGLDGSASINDTAEFGQAGVTGTAIVVNLDMAPTLKGIVFTGDGNYTIAGSNSLTLSSTSGFVTVNVNGGTQAISAPLVLDNNATTFNTTGTNSLAISGNISETGTSSLTKIGTGTLILTGTNTYSGGTFLNGGVLQLGSAGALAGDITFGGGTLQFTSSSTGFDYSAYIQASSAPISVDTNNQNITFASPLAGTGGLIKTGGGTLTLSGTSSNTYSGETFVNGGTLSLDKSPGAIAIAGSGLQDITNPDVDVNGGSLVWQQNNQLASNATVLLTSGTVDLNGNNQTVYAFKNIGGTFMTGTGTLTGTGATITWAGGTNTINTGGSMIDGHIVITGGTNTVEDGGLLQLNTGGAGFEITGSNLTLDAGTTGGEFRVQNGSLLTSHTSTTTSTISNSGTGSSGFINLSGGTSTFDIESGATSGIDLAISARITNGGLIKTGAGTLEVTGANDYLGGTDIRDGNFQIGANNSLDTSSSVNLGNGSNSGMLTLGDSTSAITQTLGGLTTTGSGTANAVVGGNASSVSTLNMANTSTVTFSGRLGGGTTTTDNLAFEASGTGSVNLTGNNNTYSGGTTVHSGASLYANNTAGSATGSGNVLVEAGGQLGGNGIIAPAAGNGVTVDDGGNLKAGLASVSATANGFLSFSGTGTGAVLTLNTPSTFTTTAQLTFDLGTGTNGITSNGAMLGTLTLAGSSTYIDLTAALTNQVVFNDNLIDLNNLAGGSLADGNYLLFTANSDSNFLFSGSTLGNGLITTGLAISPTAPYASASLYLQDGNIYVDILNTPAVPEPGTWAMLLMGLVLLAVPVYRARRR